MKKGLVLIVLFLSISVYSVFAADIDGDGIQDDADNCYNYYNPEQYDSNEDGVGDACNIYEHTIYMKQGWNLVSFPLNFGLITARSLNETLDGALDSIYYYYQNDTYAGWHYFVADYEAEDETLNVFNPAYGFWMKVKGDINLTLRAPKIYSASQTIYPGKNLIGYPWEKTAISDALGTEIDYIDLMFFYNSPLWLSWGKDKPVELNGFSELAPGYGLWINSSLQRTWNIVNGTIS